MFVRQLILMIASLSALNALADSADKQCNIVLRSAVILKAQYKVQAQIDVKNALVQSGTPFLRVVNQSDALGVYKDIRATAAGPSNVAGYTRFVVQFAHRYQPIPHLGVLAGLKTSAGGLFDWNWTSGTVGMIYIMDEYNSQNCK